MSVVVPHRFGPLLHYAMRYAMGRMTYAVDDVVQSIRYHWLDITPNDREQLARDLTQTIARVESHGQVLGDEFHHEQWKELQTFMLERMSR